MATKLTKDEIEKRGRLLLRKLDDRDRMMKDHAETRKAMKQQTDALEQRIFELRQELKSGERWTPEQMEIEGASEPEEEEFSGGSDDEPGMKFAARHASESVIAKG